MVYFEKAFPFIHYVDIEYTVVYFEKVSFPSYSMKTSSIPRVYFEKVSFPSYNIKTLSIPWSTLKR